MDIALIVAIPVSIILISMTEPIVKILFQRGAFDVQASLLTSKALGYYALGLPAMALFPLVTRVYYSIQDAKTPISIGFRTLILNGVLNLFLSKNMGPSGIALSSSISITSALIYGVFDLNRRVHFEEKSHLKSLILKISISGAVMAASLLIIYGTISNILNDVIINNIFEILVSATVSVGLYATICKSLKVLRNN